MPEWAWPSSGIVYLFIIISNKPTTTTEEFDAFDDLMLIKI